MWLSIRLPQLPLEALHTENLHPENPQPENQQAIAIIEENRILCVNQSAQRQGVQVGQTVTNAFALCETIQLYQRKPQQEQQLLKNLAILVYPISSSVIIEPQGNLILEIARSLKLYKGLQSLLQSVRNSLDGESVDYQLALGHTPTSAEILSFMPLAYSLQTVSKKDQINPNKLESLLCKLSVESMLLKEKVIQQFQSVGFKNIGDLTKIPHSSLQKRFGKKTLDYLLKLFNQQADPREYFQPEDNFYQILEFNEVIHHRQGLLFPVKRLLKNLVSFLHLQQKNAQCLEWKLFDSSKSSLSFKVIFSSPQISLKNYLELTQLNLEQYQLKEPIEALALTADQLSPLKIETQELFEQAGEFKQNPHFINKIRAKLGTNNCLQLAQVSAHLPEQASLVSVDVSAISKDTQGNCHPHQPTWLLEKPKPIRLINQQLVLNGKLSIISSPQKIASNWWNSNAARDYYIAEHDNGSLYWIYFDQLKKLWFLQGIYA
jgi:protein ImuB